MGDLVKQVRTPPVRPADGVVGCVYESFVPGVWHRWLEKEILWFCFRRAEPEDVGSISFSRKVFAGTKDSAKCIGPVRWPAAAECLTR
ncbi:hypothetical protein CRH03_13285 [Clostridium sp. HMb25]|nr:hypothetical protein CRH03_13285 [Clostridium sp. HMb25]